MTYQLISGGDFTPGGWIRARRAGLAEGCDAAADRRRQCALHADKAVTDHGGAVGAHQEVYALCALRQKMGAQRTSRSDVVDSDEIMADVLLLHFNVAVKQKAPMNLLSGKFVLVKRMAYKQASL